MSTEPDPNRQPAGAPPTDRQSGPEEASLARLRRLLQEAFNPAAAGHLDAVLGLEVRGRLLLFRVSGGTLEFDLPAGTRPDATFTFDDQETAMALLSGAGDTFGAFMDGRFRSDGYLLWAFTLLAMFRAPGPPVDLE